MPRAIAVVVLMSSLVACDEGRRPGGGPAPTARRDAGAVDPDGATGEDAAADLDAAGPGRDAAPMGFSDAAPMGFNDAAPMGFNDAAVGFNDAAPGFADAAPDAGPPVMNGTIGDIRGGAIPFGATVTLSDVVVTAFHDEATRPDSLWVQDPRGGAAYAGMKVYVRGTHSASVNARVDVTGVVTDYFGETEINNATVVARGTFTALTPVPLTVLDAMDESREGMLVQLTDVFTTAGGYSCAADDAMCMDARLWEVNGPGGILVYDYVYAGAAWEARTGVTRVSGVMTWRYNRRRIMPRSDADLPF